MALQEKELADTAHRERDRMYGDLITANLYRMTKGESVLQAENYYDPEGGTIDIPLDPRKSPQQNAAQYYKKYTKAKTAEAMLTLQLEKGVKEKEYLDSVLDAVSRAEGDRDLEEIRQELVETGYLRRRAKAKDRMKRPATKPLEFRSSAGLRISVGRNNLQNDRLTTKLAGKYDYWLHTQNDPRGPRDPLGRGPAARRPEPPRGRLPGRLVLPRPGGEEGPGGLHPREIREEPAGPAGMVIYTTYQTAYVDPDPTLAERLKA